MKNDNTELSDKLMLPWEKIQLRNIIKEKFNEELARNFLLRQTENASTMEELKTIKTYVNTGKGAPLIIRNPFYNTETKEPNKY